ncbi:MAG: serine/threonine-protein kinase [Elusimicrobiota bacterium]
MRIAPTAGACLRAGLLLSLIAPAFSCRYSGAGGQASQAAVDDLRKAERELDAAADRLGSAKAMHAEVETSIKYLSRQAEDSEDRLGKTWWSRKKRGKLAELHQTKTALQAAGRDHIQAGRRYLAAELEFRGQTGVFHDSERADSWERHLKELYKSGALEPDKVGHDRWLWPIVALAALLIAALLVFLRRRRAARDQGPEIRVRRIKKPDAEQQPLLAGRYRLEQVIGRGGTARVWRGRDQITGGEIAVKQMTAGSGPEAALLREYYLKEARTLPNLRHANIVRFIELAGRNMDIFLVFEFVAGKTLQHFIVERGRLSWRVTRGVFARVTDALAFAHEKGIIHRDLKPANIMVGDKGDVKVMDFGFARPVERGPAPGRKAPGPRKPQDLPVSRTDMVCGTPPYMCPEGVQGIVSPGTDVFSLGASIYECVTGKLPFGPRGWSKTAAARYVAPSTLAPELACEVDELITQMLDPDLSKRISSMAEISHRLKEL